MASAEPTRDAEVRGALGEERRQLADAVKELRNEIGDGAAVRARVRRVAAGVLGGTLLVGFAAGSLAGVAVGRRLHRR
jgi:hypothetical protein